MPVNSKRFDPNQDPAKALMVLRFIWAALLMGQVVFLAVALIVRSQSAASADGQMLRMIFYVSLAFGGVTIPVAFVARRIATGSDRPIPINRYFTGTIVFLAFLEAVSMFGLVTIFLGQPVTTGLIMPAVAIALQAISFPMGPATTR